jgi:multidrug resistance efflux pump
MTALLQVEGAAMVAAPQGGQITAMRVASGQAVAAGDLLFGIETEAGHTRVRAPATGQVQQMAELTLGSDVRPGDILVVIVPPGALRVVAHFPSDILGQVQPGLPARLHVDSTVGIVHTIPATVAQVVQDSQTRQVRVVLTLPPDQDIPLELPHGLNGRVDIDVAQVAPAMLVLRTVDRIATSR